MTDDPQVPLGPHETLAVLSAVEHLPFTQATSTWPNRFIRTDAKRVLVDSVAAHLGRMGWRRAEDGNGVVPLRDLKTSTG